MIPNSWLPRRRPIHAYPQFLAHLPRHRSPNAYEPDASRLAEAALALALFRSVEGDTVDRFDYPERLFFYRTSQGTEVDFVVHSESGTRAAESKYIDDPSLREARAMVTNFGGGLLLTRSAIDISSGVTIIPAAVFTWLLDQRG